MRPPIRPALPLLAAAALAAGAQAAGTRPAISMVGATPSAAGIVVVKVKIAGWKMLPARVGEKPNTPGAGHWHVFVDGKYDGYSASATVGRTTKLSPGPHSITAELANNDHSSLKPPVRSAAVTVTVPAPAAAADPTPSPPAASGGGGYSNDYSP